MKWKLLLLFAGAIAAASGSERPRASSYIFRSFDAAPGRVVYLRPVLGRSKLVFPEADKREAIRVKTNIQLEEDGSDEAVRVDDSEEDLSKVLPLKKETKHSEESGESYEEEYSVKKDEKGQKGYKSSHGAEKGSKGSYDKEGHSHSYANEGDRKKSHHDEDGYEKKHHDEEHRTRGGNHGERKHHRKGSKTTGYHNVYHKDEFKKEHIFYDTADHSGQFKKYGSAHKEHSKDAEEYAKGGHKEEAHEEKKDSRRGHSEGEKYDSKHREYKKERGDTKEHKNRDEYQRKNGRFGLNVHGYRIYHE